MRIPDFQEYKFTSFIHAGGSGMQFRVQPKNGGSEQALKVARAYFFSPSLYGNDEFSPVSQAELKALELFGHSHLVRLFRVIREGNSTVALCTTLVKDARQIDQSLDRVGSSDFGRSIRSSNPACSDVDLWAKFLIGTFLDVASALCHMHENGVYHFDVKSANILVSVTSEAILIDIMCFLRQRT